MSGSVANILLTGVTLGLLLLPASADDPPTLDMGPTCDAAAAGAISLGRDKRACMQEEDGVSGFADEKIGHSIRRSIRRME
jgi:hypothetical protein